uniref:Uncharacterized protein n=1 Tax=Oryza brachyantha TaxID=4533 RepID=J3L8L6_ORYBR
MAGGGGGDSRRREKRAKLEESIKGTVTLQAYTGMAVTVMTYLTFTWSTVVLLGGFVSSLQRKDFQCLTVITVIDATRIFNDMESRGRPNFYGFWKMRRTWTTGNDVLLPLVSQIRRLGSPSAPWARLVLLFDVVLSKLANAVLIVLVLFYVSGPYICIGLALWRLNHRDYHHGGGAGDGGEANLTPALDFFYALALCQSLLYYLLIRLLKLDGVNILSFYEQSLFPREWCYTSVTAYIQHTRELCESDPGLSKASSLLTYAIGLLDAESQKEYLSGARILDVLINDGEDARSIVLGSRSKVQRLLDTLGSRSTAAGSGNGNNDTEIRVLAARIVADLAGGIRLSQFPGAIRSVSTLLETTGQPYCNNGHLHTATVGDHLQEQNKIGGGGNGGGSSSNELILQGLRILEGLAPDARNCTEICTDRRLVAKITTPLYSATLMQDIGGGGAGGGGVVHQLIRVRVTAPAAAGSLRHEISSDEHAMSNLEGILHRRSEAAEAIGQELQMRAMEVLTQLVLDSSVSISSETREQLVRKQLEIFLPHGDGVEATGEYDSKRMLTATAGETLVSILSKCKPISLFILRERNDIIDHLSGMLDGKHSIRDRTMSARILENLCTHCDQHIKEALLRKVLTEILKTSTKSEITTAAPGSKVGIRKKYSQGGDLEKQCPNKKGQKAHGKSSRGKNKDQHENVSSKKDDDQQANDSSQKKDERTNDSSNKGEDQPANQELLEAQLSLALLLHAQLFYAESSSPVIQDNGPDDQLVKKLKDVVDGNDQATPISLRIVKLCGQIAASIMRRNPYVSDERNKFVESLSVVSKTMANLESCMLFGENDCGLQRTARPLLSDLEEELKRLVR